ncbi:hypothetical protein Xmau_03022 [Xenorhabdus mauleonii]|uniref:Peptidase C80 family protein n=1 Tax=Xenorhabdus mauleonii TaxID=351675 RepID=A0A1I3SE74_9GAMM|nr:C80 family cysteine peptidase [Xenorhabdus mauleonii]PHM39117.1 hypothetical protein Xmau_03022 [Xenorhabdus mauleonii]SFJ55827.1 Peptidase C80 family protein [Xenorhabdus mauleonii]
MLNNDPFKFTICTGEINVFDDNFNGKLRLNIHAHGEKGYLLMSLGGMSSQLDAEDLIKEIEEEAEVLDKIKLNHYGYVRLLSCSSADDGPSGEESIASSLSKYLNQYCKEIIIQGYRGIINIRSMGFYPNAGIQGNGLFRFNLDKNNRELKSLPNLEQSHGLKNILGKNHYMNKHSISEVEYEKMGTAFDKMQKVLAGEVDRVEPTRVGIIQHEHSDGFDIAPIDEVWFCNGKITNKIYIDSNINRS